MKCQGPNCFNEIEPMPDGYHSRNFCSDICHAAAYRARFAIAKPPSVITEPRTLSTKSEEDRKPQQKGQD